MLWATWKISCQQTILDKTKQEHIHHICNMYIYIYHISHLEAVKFEVSARLGACFSAFTELTWPSEASLETLDIKKLQTFHISKPRIFPVICISVFIDSDGSPPYMRNSIDLHFHRSTNGCHQEINYSNIHCIQEFASHRARMTRDEGRTHQWPWSRSMHLAQLDPWRREAWNQTARHNPLARCLRLDSRAPFPLRLQVWCLHVESKDRRGCLNTKAVQFGLSHVIHVYSIHGVCLFSSTLLRCYWGNILRHL